jgi:nucleoside 2-deoxyribosyltransferase
VKVYLAAKSKHHEFIAALGAAGLSLSATWPYWRYNREPGDPSADAWKDHALACRDQVKDCDLLVLYVADETEQHFGALIECGIAIGHHKPIYLITPHPWPFLRHMPNVRSFASLPEAITSIISLQHGTQLRALRERGEQAA